MLPQLARFNILGAFTALQGFITMLVSWSILYRAETAQLTANDQRAKVLLKQSYDTVIRLKAIKDRITAIADKSKPHGNSTAVMLGDLEIAIIDFASIRDYCADMENLTWIERWRFAKTIGAELQDLEARAKDPSHLLNLTLSGVFALLEQRTGSVSSSI